jgi:DNA-binding HxlR family transcriptional regulator
VGGEGRFRRAVDVREGMDGDDSESAEATLGIEDLSPAELGERLHEASELGRSLFTLLGRAGTLELLYQIGANGPVRFTELKRSLDVSSATLSARLSELADAGFVERRSYDEMPPRVEYTATARLRDLKPALYHLLAWAERHGYEADGTTAGGAAETADGQTDGGVSGGSDRPD